MENLKSLLINEKNLKSMVKDKKTNNFNLSKLLGVELTQSQSVRFGFVFEDFIKNLIITSNNNLLNLGIVYPSIKNKKIKNKEIGKQIDISFNNEDTVYYFESKTNCWLDTEKTKVTDEKIELINKYLNNVYPEKNIISAILTAIYDRDPSMITNLKTKIFFMSDFFKLIGIDCSKEEYENMMLEFGKSIKEMEKYSKSQKFSQMEMEF